MIEKELFIGEYKKAEARFYELINSIDIENKADKLDMLIGELDTLTCVLPSVNNIDVEHWKQKLVKLKIDIFNEMVLIENYDECRF